MTATDHPRSCSHTAASLLLLFLMILLCSVDSPRAAQNGLKKMRHTLAAIRANILEQSKWSEKSVKHRGNNSNSTRGNAIDSAIYSLSFLSHTSTYKIVLSTRSRFIGRLLVHSPVGILDISASFPDAPSVGSSRRVQHHLLASSRDLFEDELNN